MRTLPSVFGVLRGDRLTGAAAANRTALVMLAVRTDGHDGVGRLCPVRPVECEIDILAGVAHLSGVQSFCAHPGMRDDPAPPRCGGPATVLTYRRDPHLRRFDPPDDGPSETGVDDGRRLEKRRMSPCPGQF